MNKLSKIFTGLVTMKKNTHTLFKDCVSAVPGNSMPIIDMNIEPKTVEKGVKRINKVEKLKLKYENTKVVGSIFDFFLEADPTKTHKYLEYMLSMWVDDNVDIIFIDLANWVIKFDKLLPYIENKDIYSKDYRNITHLVRVVQSATHKSNQKKSKTQKQKDVDIVKETKTYTIYFPKTHEASIKYGSGTTWCTTMKEHERTFQRYHRKGLVYIISKKRRKKNYKKVAFVKSNTSQTNYSISIYNEIDESVSRETLISNGWSRDDMVEIYDTYQDFLKTLPPTEEYDRMGYPMDINLNLTPEMTDDEIQRTREFAEVVWDEPLLDDIDDIGGMFSGCTSLTDIPDISPWSSSPSLKKKSMTIPEWLETDILTINPCKEVIIEGVTAGRNEMFQKLFRDRQEQKILQERKRENSEIIGHLPSLHHRTTTVKPRGSHQPILGTPSGIHPTYGESYTRRVKVRDDGKPPTFKRFTLGVDMAKPGSSDNCPIATFIDHADLLKTPTPRDKLKDFQKQIDMIAKLFRDKYKNTINKWDELPNK